jgi:hypothetical protein
VDTSVSDENERKVGIEWDFSEEDEWRYSNFFAPPLLYRDARHRTRVSFVQIMTTSGCEGHAGV